MCIPRLIVDIQGGRREASRETRVESRGQLKKIVAGNGWRLRTQNLKADSGPVDWGANVTGIVNVLDRSHNC